MDSELQILKNIDKNKEATQREIAKVSGISLGNVNLLIKRLVKKGLLKIEKLNSKTIRYILTPQGMREKTEATYRYIVASFKHILEINNKVDALLNSQVLLSSKGIVLFGNSDEVSELLKAKLEAKNLKYIHIDSINQSLDEVLNDDCFFIVWHPDYQEVVSKKDLQFVNLLDEM